MTCVPSCLTAAEQNASVAVAGQIRFGRVRTAESLDTARFAARSDRQTVARAWGSMRGSHMRTSGEACVDSSPRRRSKHSGAGGRSAIVFHESQPGLACSRCETHTLNTLP